MKTLTVRTVPDSVYESLKAWAKANHRSMQEQILSILDREVTLLRGATPERARQWRRKLSGRNWGNVIEDIRSERQR